MKDWFQQLRQVFSFKGNVHTEGFPKQFVDFKNAFQALVENQKLPGIAISIWKDGEIFHEEGYGYENLENKTKVDPSKTVFRIASISKCITGLALGKAVEEGLLDWDTSLYEYIPYYPKKEYDFTIRQLASHTAGIRGYRGKEFALNKSLGIKDSLELFKNEPLLFKPGQGYLYNSFDFVLLSLAIQEVANMSFDSYVKLKVLEPLQMKHTYTPNEVSKGSFDSDEVSISHFYTRRGKGFRKAVKVNNQYKIGGGGYLSTSVDIAKMGQAVLDRKLLNESTYDEILKAQKIKDNSVYYGLGFQVSEDVKGRAYVGHVGNSVGAYSNFYIYPEENVVISLLINCTDPKVQADIDTAILSIF